MFLDMQLIKEGIHQAHDQAMNLSLLVASIGGFLSISMYLIKIIDPDKIAKKLNFLGLYSLSFKKFFIDDIYNSMLYRPFMAISWLCSKVDWDLYDQKFIDGWGWLTLKISDVSGKFDYKWIDQRMVDGFGKFTKYFGFNLRLTQTGIVQNYLLASMLGVIFLIIIFQQF